MIHGARDYDPRVGRWTAKDPILFNGGQTNLYAYVANDPVNYVDPEGEFAVSGSALALYGLYTAGAAAAVYTAYQWNTVVAPALAPHVQAGLRATAELQNSIWDYLTLAGEQDKVLTRGEIRKLIGAGHHPHDLKPKKHGSRYDLYKNPNGDICVKPKGGAGEGDPTGLNIKDL